MPTENETDPASCRRGSVSDGGGEAGTPGSGEVAEFTRKSTQNVLANRTDFPASPFLASPPTDGGVTEWLMVADCKSAGLTPYVGSNPTPTMEAGQQGSGAVIERVGLEP